MYKVIFNYYANFWKVFDNVLYAYVLSYSSKANHSILLCWDAHKHQKDISGRCKMYPTIPYNISEYLRPSGHFDRMQPATSLCGTLTRKVSLTSILFFFK